MIIISLFLLGTLMSNLSFTAHVNVGIVNGWEAKPHSRPYMVSVQKNKEHVCGGFLISDEFVMTVAHCRNDNEILTVVVGAHDLKAWQSGSVRIRVKQYYKHPDFVWNNVTLQNDIMLLKLDKKVKLNQNVSWISIPKKKEDIKADSLCSVAGWGKLSLKDKPSDRLMETDVRIIENRECKEKWGKFYLASQMMCVYGDGGSCKGDSGGPLVCGNTAVGVTTFVSKRLCNSRVLPNVYTEISAFLPWIQCIIKSVN